MALLLSLLTTLVALVVISYVPSGSLGCDLPQTHILLSRENLMILRQMRRISPFSCLNHTQDFRFPGTLVRGSQAQEAQAISVLHQMLRHISDLLLTEHASAAWNTTLLNHLRTGVYRLLLDLEPCLVPEVREEGTAAPMQGAMLAVRRYFEGICLYLKEKKYSDCAWEVVRVEIMRSLSSIRTLQERLRNKDRDVQSP